MLLERLVNACWIITGTNLENGFQTCGLSPVNRKEILRKLSNNFPQKSPNISENRHSQICQGKIGPKKVEKKEEEKRRYNKVLFLMKKFIRRSSSQIYCSYVIMWLNYQMMKHQIMKAVMKRFHLQHLQDLLDRTDKEICGTSMRYKYNTREILLLMIFL